MYSKEELSELINRGMTSLSFDDEAERLIEPVRYILSLGGKRLRPLMTLMSCNIFSDNPEEALMPAIGLEVFHNFTLVHDDIMDNAPLRRGKPTVHARWNSNQAVLSGDAMAFIANECMAQAPKESFMKVFRLYNQTAIQVCIGQQMDMDFEQRSHVSLNEYLRMVELKTAVLVAACMKTGALIGGASDTDAGRMYEFGRSLGLAFQIQDDILDVYGDAALFGKATGGDIVSNKKTFLLIRALELSTGDINRRLHELVAMKEFDPEEKVRAVKEIYDTLGIK
ncbi:MAG: polyprenyl synthetase family protein, partial [Bacteroidales bacterium]|nr:polyprenyl synthetase family protein [Bacteroidales bacterium]